MHFTQGGSKKKVTPQPAPSEPPAAVLAWLRPFSKCDFSSVTAPSLLAQLFTSEHVTEKMPNINMLNPSGCIPVFISDCAC